MGTFEKMSELCNGGQNVVKNAVILFYFVRYTYLGNTQQ